MYHENNDYTQQYQLSWAYEQISMMRIKYYGMNSEWLCKVQARAGIEAIWKVVGNAKWYGWKRQAPIYKIQQRGIYVANTKMKIDGEPGNTECINEDKEFILYLSRAVDKQDKAVLMNKNLK